MRNCPPQVLAQIGKRGERIAIPGNEPYRVAIGVGKSAKTVVLQLKEPIRMGKGNRPADERERLNMRQSGHGFYCRTGQALSYKSPTPVRDTWRRLFFGRSFAYAAA